jgi:pyruvate kinase
MGPRELCARLESLRDEMRRRYVAQSAVFGRVHPLHTRSAQNLVDYLTLRSHDIRPLQDALAELGVSSLGRAEEHVIRSVEQVICVLQALSGDGDGYRTEVAVDFREGRKLLEANAARLLGPAPVGRGTRIMVTMPSEAAGDATLVRDLIRAGMDAARVNCAHDDPRTWVSIVTNVRREASAAGRTCPVLMDLPGPKLRTGPIADGPMVVRLRPPRDARGVPVAPARAVLVAGAAGERDEGGQSPDDLSVSGPRIPVDGAWLERLEKGGRISTRDTRGSPRTFEVEAVEAGRVSVAVWDTTYVESGMTFRGPAGTTTVGRLPPMEQALRVHVGDRVTLTDDLTPAPPLPERCDGGPATCRIGCTLPAALALARPGHRVWFDDGKIGGVVAGTRPGEVDVEITASASGGSNLRAARGINLPDTDLDLPAFGPEDDAVIRFVASHGDLVGLSFAQRTSDIAELQRRLGELGADVGIVLKIETAGGFQRLPELLLAGMASERVGVMVARGDLAVECGFERLAEVQDEILWLCDAGHVPVVWATQVLDQMARTGLPSRAEVSDAVMAARSECVMLNKGPHIAEAVEALDDILRRVETHQHKKVPLLRRLRSWSPQ